MGWKSYKIDLTLHINSEGVELKCICQGNSKTLIILNFVDLRIDVKGICKISEK